MTHFPEEEWSTRQLDFLRKEYEAGMSMTEIGRRLGKSRSAIASAIRRNGLSLGEAERQRRLIEGSMKGGDATALKFQRLRNSGEC